jgi:hypothetical protein
MFDGRQALGQRHHPHWTFHRVISSPGYLLGQAQRQLEREQARADKKRIAELERDLRRKDKALAETAAILVLRKKMNGFWGSDNEDV